MLSAQQGAVKVGMPAAARVTGQLPSLRWMPVIVLLALFPGNAGYAQSSAPQQNNETAVTIQYRDLVDQSIYGHSGRPAGMVLDELARSTPREIATQFVEGELGRRIEELEAKLDAAEEAKDGELVTETKVEIDRLESILDDEDLLAKETDSYASKHADLLTILADLARQRSQALVSDVEPVCEPAAFVLNDALARKIPATLNPDLVELAAFYPPGRVEPGWADLVRTGRIVIYTDGGSYCRLFLPGKSAQDAWESAYPVARHILLSLLRPDSPRAVLDVDVYGFENDISSTTLTLHLQKYSRRLAAKDLGPPSGRAALDLGALSRFFAAGLTLEGCVVDPAGRLVLIGGEGAAPTLDEHPIELSDLAVAYRASAYAGHGESYMSLDKCEDDDYVNVNFGGRLQDTRLGWVAYRCDLRLKTLGDDFDPVTFENVEGKILGKLPDYMSQQKRMFSDPEFRNISGEGTRFWFYPDDFKVVVGGDGKSCLVTRPRFTAAAERDEGFDSAGMPIETKTPAWTTSTLEHFNANYDEFAQIFPEVRELNHAARLLAVGEWLFQAQQKKAISLDLDQLLALPLPVSPTPRRREQLRIAYAVKRTGIPAEFVAYCVSTPHGKAEFERASEKYAKPGSEWKRYSVVSGGLDYNARKPVAQAREAGPAERTILEQSSSGAISAQGLGGKKFKMSSAFTGGQPPKGPPNDGFVAASAPEPGPEGKGTIRSMRRSGQPEAFVVTTLAVEEGESRRCQTQNSDAFYKDGAVHSIWIDEHGQPERFARKITSEIVAFGLEARGDGLEVKRIPEQRGLTGVEADFIAAALTEKKLAISQVWNLAPVDADVRAIDVTPGRAALVCFGDAGIDVVRIYKSGRAPVEFRGQEALSRMHEASREKVRAFSVPGKVELLHASADGDSVVLQIGKRDPIRLDANEWGKWLSSEGATAPPEPLASVFKELERSAAELVVMRDALQSKPQRLRRGDPRSPDGFSKFLDKIRTARLALLRLSSEELQAKIDGIKRDREELPTQQKAAADAYLERFEKVQALTPDEKTAAIAEVEGERQAQMIEAAVYKTTGDAVVLTDLLKSKLRNLRVSYDDPSPVVPQRVLGEPVVKSSSDIGLAIPPGNAGVEDKGILKTVAASFLQNKVPLIKSPADLAKVGNVIVVTAHNNQALFDYLQDLGSYQINGKSALDGKILMLTTCFEKGNPNLVSELLRRYNCIGVHVQTEQVNKDAVKRVLIELGKSLRELDRGAPPQRLRDIYDESVRRLLRSNDESIKDLKPELEKLLNARIQWCLNRPIASWRPLGGAA